MKKAAKTIVSVVILPLLLMTVIALTTGCDLLETSKQTNDGWWVYNYQTHTYYQTQAKFLYEGTSCVVYVEAEYSNVCTSNDARAIAIEFDTNVFAKITNKFGPVPDEDSDGKITIFVLDIKDGWSGSGNYTAGFFDPRQERDLLYSNKKDMLYMDLFPGTPGDPVFNMTMAHELQHMINFNEKYFVQSGHYQDTWINEGLSSAAEVVYVGSNILLKTLDYNNDLYQNYRKGKNFVTWEGVYENYVTVYLFFQWLRMQSLTGDNMFHEIITNLNDNYLAVENIANVRLYSGTWHDFFRDWLIARLYNNSSGKYGYKDFITNTSYAISVGSNYHLYPGEAIYVYQLSNVSLTPSGTIDFTGLHTVNKWVSNTSPYYGNRLLVYNFNGTNNSVLSSTGVLPETILTKGFDVESLNPNAMIYKSDLESGRIKLPVDISFDGKGNPVRSGKRR